MAAATETNKAAAKKSRSGRAGSKSGAIRAYLKRHPEAGPTAVCAALKRKGIVISPAHVSNVKAAMARKAGSGGAAANGVVGRRGRKRASGGDAVSMGQLIEARKFAAQVGGVDHAVGLLQTLAKLQ
jgi:hypothetical protein